MFLSFASCIAYLSDLILYIGVISSGGGMEMKEIMVVIAKNPKKAPLLSNYLEVNDHYEINLVIFIDVFQSLFLAYTFGDAITFTRMRWVP